MVRQADAVKFVIFTKSDTSVPTSKRKKDMARRRLIHTLFIAAKFGGNSASIATTVAGTKMQ